MGVARIKPNVSGSLEWPFELGENLNAGDPIFPYDDAGTTKIKKVYTVLNDKDSFARGYYHATCYLDNNRFVVAYRDTNNSSFGTLIVGEKQIDDSINWGAPLVFQGASVYHFDIAPLSGNYFAVSYSGLTNGETKIGEVQGDLSITLGSAVIFNTGSAYYISSDKIAFDKIVICYQDVAALNRGTAIVGIRSGMSINFGTEVVYRTSYSTYNTVTRTNVDNKFTVFYRAGSPSCGKVRVATVTGDIINPFGTEQDFDPLSASYIKACALDTDKVMCVYRADGDGGKGKGTIGIITGAEIAMGVRYIFDEQSTYYPDVTAFGSDCCVMWQRYAAPYSGMLRKGEITGTVIDFTNEQKYQEGRAYYNNILEINNGLILLIWYGYNESTSYALITTEEMNLLGFTVGLMQESGLSGEKKKVDLLGGLTEQLSGMTIGYVQYIQDDGSISELTSDYPIARAIESNVAIIGKGV